jgi:hypothetical protein
MLGEAVPRDDSEAVQVDFNIPALTGDEARVSMAIRRGFVGTIALREYGGTGYEGRTRVSAVFRRWDGDRPIFDYEHERI